MDFKEYPSYKNSGVEWLGDVPEHWNLKRFGYLFDENKKKNIGLQETNVLSLSYGNIKEKNIDDNKGLLPESFETYQIIEPNNIVFRFTDLQNDKRSLRSAISKYHGIITSAYIAVKTKQNADFYNYLFRAYDLQKVFYSMGEGMRQSLKMDELNKMPVVLPSKDEQKRIVSFLDTETARIDNLIAKQEKLIELLEEQRKSIISHAVTKGLNPNAPMKDSGVEWLGEVPENFNCIKLKQLAIGKLTYGANESADQEVKEHPRYIRITDIKEDGTLNPETFKSLSPETAEQYLLSNNDILFARSGATVGKTFKYSDSWGVCCFAGYLIKISINAKIANPDYIFYYLNSHAYWEYVSSNQSQSTIQNVSAEKYANFTIAVPKLAEQNAIVNYLNKETERLNILIAKQKTLIEKLKEYRASIISHAVTGKINVQELDA